MTDYTPIPESDDIPTVTVVNNGSPLRVVSKRDLSDRFIDCMILSLMFITFGLMIVFCTIILPILNEIRNIAGQLW